MLGEKIEAVFENGVFRPLQPIHLEERQRVTLLLPAATEASHHASPTDGEEFDVDVGYVPLPLEQCKTIRVSVRQIDPFLPVSSPVDDSGLETE